MYKLINFCSVATVIAAGSTITSDQPLRNLADGDTPAPAPLTCGDYQIKITDANGNKICATPACAKNEIILKNGSCLGCAPDKTPSKDKKTCHRQCTTETLNMMDSLEKQLEVVKDQRDKAKSD